ncbi:MAG TPA: hypothetical protein VGJ20_03235 [Xanthobacteraceae bacterium]
MRHHKLKLSRGLAFAAVLASAALTSVAQAADPVFPTGSRIGLVPPAGMATSHTFPGFEDSDKKAAILISTMPAAAYPEIEKSAADEVLKKQGFIVEKREPMQLSFGKGFLITGKLSLDKVLYRKWLLAAPATNLTALVSVQVPQPDATYSDAAVRAALSTLAVRATVPEAELLSLLPFKVGALAGFHIDDVLPGRALMLVDPRTDQDTKAPIHTFNARFLVAAEQGGPSDPDERGEFARLLFDRINGIKDVRVNMSEPLPFNGQPGFQTMAQAKDARSNEDLMVVQWLRFGGGVFLQMVGISRADIWTDELARLRRVRDSIDPQ